MRNYIDLRRLWKNLLQISCIPIKKTFNNKQKAYKTLNSEILKNTALTSLIMKHSPICLLVY